jgi:hypothetical protein
MRLFGARGPQDGIKSLIRARHRAASEPLREARDRRAARIVHQSSLEHDRRVAPQRRYVEAQIPGSQGR